MTPTVERRTRSFIPALALATVLLFAAHGDGIRAEDPAAPESDWNPSSTFEGNFDWLQMKNGEWLKGEIIAMYEEKLEFDSDEFGDFTIDWDDIAQLHSAGVMNVGFVGGGHAVGVLWVHGDSIAVTTDGERLEFERSQLLSLTAGVPKEINFWSMKVFFGLVLRQGNSEVREVNFQANLRRRTIKNRIAVDAIANENTTDDVQISDNQRTNLAWDRFINQRFFLKPVFAEYLRDPFQNIGARYTVGTGAGYQLIDSSKLEWQVSGGPGYQETRFDSIEIGETASESTPALLIATAASWDIAKWLEFDGSYRIQLVSEESGTFNHHMVISFETDITKRIDLDVSWIWDRIQDPRADENGVVPQQDDIRTTVGLTFEF